MPEEVALSRRFSETQSPTLREVAAVFFRQRRLMGTSFLCLFLGVALYGALFPSYESHMKVLVRRSRFDPMVTPQASAPLEYSRDDIPEEELNSEVELLTDENLLRQVVADTGLTGRAPARWLHLWESDDARLERAARNLGQKLKVEPVRKTSLITVSYAASDPQQAARVLKSLVALYVAKHTSVHRPSGESVFFEGQREAYGQKLREAESGLMGFANSKGIASATLERDLTLQRLSDAEAVQRQTRLSASETGQKVRALEQLLPALPQRTTTQVRFADNPQLQEKLKSKLLELQLKRTELLTKFEPSYRLVREVDRQIAETRDAITAERLTPLKDETSERDPNYEWARTELEKARVELTSLQARASAGDTELERMRGRAQQLEQATVEQERLLRTLKTAEENYLLYVRKREESRIGDALDEQGILNVAVVQEPVAPALPKRSAPLMAAFGLLAATVVSTGLGFVRDYLDPAFRCPGEVVEFLEAPVLASLPHEADQPRGMRVLR
jgi:uncharacterized protein involved in exopolysaccharide biosynthesis